MTSTDCRGRDGAQAGVTLLEFLAAIALVGVVAVIASRVLGMLTDSAASHDAHIAQQDLINLLTKNLSNTFATRANPDTYSGTISAGGSGLSVAHAQHADFTQTSLASFQTTCVNLPANHHLQAAELATLGAMAQFTCPTAPCGSCLTCRAGQAPVVKYDESDDSKHLTYPPASGGGVTTQAIASAICVAALLTPPGGGPKDLLITLNTAVVTPDRRVVVRSSPFELTVSTAAAGIQIIK